MPLPSGTRLGPYEILSPLGAGGMREVYKARDTRLGRDVAVKVLPSHVSCGSARASRSNRALKSGSFEDPNPGAQSGLDLTVNWFAEVERKVREARVP